MTGVSTTCLILMNSVLPFNRDVYKLVCICLFNDCVNFNSQILLCDKCDAAYHTACLRPPLLTVPQGDWFCPFCQQVGYSLFYYGTE